MPAEHGVMGCGGGGPHEPLVRRTCPEEHFGTHGPSATTRSVPAEHGVMGCGGGGPHEPLVRRTCPEEHFGTHGPSATTRSVPAEHGVMGCGGGGPHEPLVRRTCPEEHFGTHGPSATTRSVPAGHSCPGTEEGVVGLPPKLVVDALTVLPLHVIAYSTLRISVEFLDSFGTFRNSTYFLL